MNRNDVRMFQTCRDARFLNETQDFRAGTVFDIRHQSHRDVAHRIVVAHLKHHLHAAAANTPPEFIFILRLDRKLCRHKIIDIQRLRINLRSRLHVGSPHPLPCLDLMDFILHVIHCLRSGGLRRRQPECIVFPVSHSFTL